MLAQVTDLSVFQEQTDVKLPHGYTAFLTRIGDGIEIQFDSFIYCFPPLAELKFDPECIGKWFSHRFFRLIVVGGAKGEVWDMADVGFAPYGNGLDFLDWMKDFLDGKVMG